jgi:hypothetical protein
MIRDVCLVLIRRQPESGPIVSAWVTLMPYVSARRRDVRFGCGRNNSCDRADCVARPSRLIRLECIAENQLTGKTASPPLRILVPVGEAAAGAAGKQCAEITAETLGHDLWTTRRGIRPACYCSLRTSPLTGKTRNLNTWAKLHAKHYHPNF